MALRLQLIVEGHLFPENWALFMDRGILRSLGRGAFFSGYVGNRVHA